MRNLFLIKINIKRVGIFSLKVSSKRLGEPEIKHSTPGTLLTRPVVYPLHHGDSKQIDLEYFLDYLN